MYCFASQNFTLKAHVVLKDIRKKEYAQDIYIKYEKDQEIEIKVVKIRLKMSKTKESIITSSQPQPHSLKLKALKSTERIQKTKML